MSATRDKNARALREQERSAGVLSERLKRANGMLVEFGVAGVHPSGVEAGTLAKWLIEGTPTSPARDFMSIAADEARLPIDRGMRQASQAILRGADPRPALARARDAAHEAVVRSIDTFTTPGNAPSTIAGKGEDNPLDDSGALMELAFAGYAVGSAAGKESA